MPELILPSGRAALHDESFNHFMAASIDPNVYPLTSDQIDRTLDDLQVYPHSSAMLRDHGAREALLAKVSSTNTDDPSLTLLRGALTDICLRKKQMHYTAFAVQEDRIAVAALYKSNAYDSTSGWYTEVGRRVGIYSDWIISAPDIPPHLAQSAHAISRALRLAK
jgi:hypothetical protein